MKINISLPHTIKGLFAVYCTSIVIFFLFRVLFLVVNAERFLDVLDEDGGWLLIIKAFIMGFRFDTVIACYLLAPALLAFSIAYLFNYRNNRFYKIIHGYLFVLFSISFIISVIDIPYFQQFFNRFTVQAFGWMKTPSFVFKMIFQESIHLVYLFLLIGLLYGYHLIMKKIYRKWLLFDERTVNMPTSSKMKVNNAVVLLLLMSICFLGIRGRFATKSPIRVGTAYFSNEAIINQTGLNPTFTLIKSIEEKSKNKSKELHLIDKSEAQAFVKEEFQRMKQHPIGERKYQFDNKTNVVLVIMESMGSCYIGHFGNGNLTPNLDDLLNKSVSYENVYTAGIHTYNGVYSTLFGQPALMDIHSMQRTIIPEMTGGLPGTFKEKGYETYYFTTHDEQFDNIGGFLAANGVEKIIAQQDYPNSEIKSALGVPDHIMFNKVIDELNHRETKEPFFAAVLTGSNHMPYILPENISLKTKSKNIKNKMIEYSDWAIGKFIQDAQKCDWFDNTLFVFVADHGAFKGVSLFEVPLSFHHTPLLFYAPKKLPPTRVNNMGLQLDIPALISSYFGIDNEGTLGIPFDIYPRKYVYFSADDKLGVLDEEYFYIWNRNGKEYLYKYKTKDKTNYLDLFPDKAKEMKKYAFSMLISGS